MIDFENIGMYRENNRIEAKTALGGFPQSLWETYSAFANTLGGLILLGVVENKDKTFHTVNLPDPEGHLATLWEGLNSKKIVSANILTAADAFIQQVGDHRIVVIQVPQADRLTRPIYIENNPALVYKRNGEGDYKATPEEYAAMVRDAAEKSQDMQVLLDFTLDDLAREAIGGFRQRMAAIRPGVMGNLIDLAFLEKVGTVVQNEGAIRPTMAGLLMFGKIKAIRRAFPHYRLELVRDGVTLVSSEEPRFGNLYDFFFRACALLRKSFHNDVFPGIREALTNALVHADYYLDRPIRVELSSRSVTFENPGLFRVALGSAVQNTLSDPRNAVLKRLFALLNVCDSGDCGLPLIYRIWKAQGLGTPRIEEKDALTSRLVLPLALAGSSEAAPEFEISKNLIIDYLTDHPLADVGQIAAYLQCKFSYVQLLLDDLDAERLLVTDIGDKGPVYRLRA